MPDARPWFIYALADPRDDEIRYIGKSVDVATRVKCHMRDQGSTRKARWLRSLVALGLEPSVMLLQSGTGDWEIAERAWIALLGERYDLTNATEGGDGLHGPGAETREKIAGIRRALFADPEFRAKADAMYASAEWRAAVSASLKGKPKTAEHIANLPQNQKGYAWPEAVRAARRASFVKHALPQAHRGPFSEAQKAHLQRLIEANRGRPGWAKGRILTAEEREARSIKQRGVPKTPETREKMRQAALRRWARARGEEETAA